MGLVLLKSVVFWELSQNEVWSKWCSVRGNHIWVFDIFLKTEIIKNLIQIVKCSNIVVLPWFGYENEQDEVGIRGTKSREMCYFSNIMDQNINERKTAYLPWFDCTNQHLQISIRGTKSMEMCYFLIYDIIKTRWSKKHVFTKGRPLPFELAPKKYTFTKGIPLPFEPNSKSILFTKRVPLPFEVKSTYSVL